MTDPNPYENPETKRYIKKDREYRTDQDAQRERKIGLLAELYKEKRRLIKTLTAEYQLRETQKVYRREWEELEKLGLGVVDKWWGKPNEEKDWDEIRKANAVPS